jgi:hypothetical protein
MTAADLNMNFDTGMGWVDTGSEVGSVPMLASPLRRRGQFRAPNELRFER